MGYCRRMEAHISNECHPAQQCGIGVYHSISTFDNSSMLGCDST
jgi:hypothetical protein